MGLTAASLQKVQSRKRDGPIKFLGDFKGYLQADAFSGYDCIFAGGSVREVACWAHARRKFYDAQPTAQRACNEVLAMIQELYAIEKGAQSLSPDERRSERLCKSLPVLQKLKVWLDRQKLIALPKSPLGKAVTYALNNWTALCTFAEAGNLTIDNNKSDARIRPRFSVIYSTCRQSFARPKQKPCYKLVKEILTANSS